jgi:hypothetical protein
MTKRKALETVVEELRRQSPSGVVSDPTLRRVLGVSPLTTYKWRQSGLPHDKLRRRVFYRIEDVEAFLRS